MKMFRAIETFIVVQNNLTLVIFKGQLFLVDSKNDLPDNASKFEELEIRMEKIK